MLQLTATTRHGDLRRLAFNGDSTATLLPLEGSRAIGAVSQATDEIGQPLADDQRGAARSVSSAELRALTRNPTWFHYRHHVQGSIGE